MSIPGPSKGFAKGVWTAPDSDFGPSPLETPMPGKGADHRRNRGSNAIPVFYDIWTQMTAFPCVGWRSPAGVGGQRQTKAALMRVFLSGGQRDRRGFRHLTKRHRRRRRGAEKSARAVEGVARRPLGRSGRDSTAVVIPQTTRRSDAEIRAELSPQSAYLPGEASWRPRVGDKR